MYVTQKFSDRMRRAVSGIARAKHISIPTLANRAGIHYDTLRKFLNGTSDTTIDKLERMGDALGYTVSGMISWENQHRG